MIEYIKKEDVINSVSEGFYSRQPITSIISNIHKLPSTGIKQDRLEVIKAYCLVIKQRLESCPENCLLYNYNCCFHLESEQIDEAIAKIKEAW